MGGCFSTLCKTDKNNINTEDIDTIDDNASESHSRELLLNDAPSSPPIDIEKGINNDDNENKISKIEISPQSRKQTVDDMRYYGASKYREDEEVRVRIETCSTWLESHIVDYCGDHKYRIRIHRSPEFARFINGKYLRIVDEDDLRHNSKIPEPITSDSEIGQGIIDLYLNGRKCLTELNTLAQSFHQLYNNKWLTTYRYFLFLFFLFFVVIFFIFYCCVYSQRRVYGIEYIEARFVAMEIMNYCFDEKYHWRLYCFWCKQLDAKMYRESCRHHVIGSGATSQGYYGQQLSLMAFCDECNTELNYEDYSYRCINKQHDICIKCVWNKILKYNRIQIIIKPILMDNIGLDRYSCQCIIEYMVGNIRKFDGAQHSSF